MDLTTAARVKVILDLTVAQHDTILAQLITALSARAEKFLGRHVEQKARTEQYDVEESQFLFYLKGYPVAASPAAVVKADLNRTFDSGSIVATTNYYLDLDRGAIKLDAYRVVPGWGALQVAYTGGMAANVTAFITAFPHIADAIDMQTAFVFQRRDSLGLAGYSGDGGSISLPDIVQWLPQVRETLMSERRRAWRG